jgi:hypothetical protein
MIYFFVMVAIISFITCPVYVPPKRGGCLPTPALPIARAHGRPRAVAGSAPAPIIDGVTAGVAAIIGLMGAIIVVPDYFPFAYYVAGIVDMLMHHIKFVDGVVPVPDYVFVFDHTLGTGAVKNLAHYRFLAALTASVHTVASHNNSSFTWISTASYDGSGMSVTGIQNNKP